MNQNIEDLIKQATAEATTTQQSADPINTGAAVEPQETQTTPDPVAAALAAAEKAQRDLAAAQAAVAAAAQQQQASATPVNQQAQGQNQQAAQGQLINPTVANIGQSQSAPNNSLAHLPPEIAALAQPMGPMTMETAEKPQMGVGDWVKTSEYGMSLGSAKKKMIESMMVAIDMNQNSGFQLVKMVRIGAGTSTTYVHTADGIKGSDGKPWHMAVAAAYHSSNNPQRPNVPYDAALVPMVLLEDAVSGGEVIAPKGTEIGYTTPKTGWSEWYDFYQSVAKAGLVGQTVKAKLLNEEISHNGNDWGVLKWKLEA